MCVCVVLVSLQVVALGLPESVHAVDNGDLSWEAFQWPVPRFIVMLRLLRLGWRSCVEASAFCIRSAICLRRWLAVFGADALVISLYLGHRLAPVRKRNVFFQSVP